MEKKETFWADSAIVAKLATIPRSEKSTIIRMALRQWFGITANKSVEPITPMDAQLIAGELIKVGRSGS